ncbi:MAG: adenine phosphoribosyltransferase [Microgenomates group bacterium]|jgi:adenine phosphoribosyltransferase
MDIKTFIREVPNWPIKGVNFKDITTLLQNPIVFKHVINKLAKPYLKTKVDKVVGIDARGFLFAAPVAFKIGSGLCLVRKKGKLPYNTIEQNFSKEYGLDVLAIHKDTIKKNDKVIIVDDLLATGGTLLAACKLVEKLGGKIVGINVVIDLPFLGGSQKLKKYKVNSLIQYETE